MKFTVELLAYAKPGEIREVEIPEHGLHERIAYRVKLGPNEEDIPYILGTVFNYGQNDIQPQAKPSVSAGDVIHLGEDRWLVCITGFMKLHQIEYEMWKELPQAGRQRVLLNRESFIHRERKP